MSEEFRRLLDDAPEAELRSVLESGLRDHPTPRGVTRAARALGIGAVGLGSARAAAAVGSRTLRASSWALAKWGGLGVFLGGIALSPFVLKAPAVSRAMVAQPHPQPVNTASAPTPASSFGMAFMKEETQVAPSALPAQPAQPAVKRASPLQDSAALSASVAPRPTPPGAALPSPMRSGQTLAPTSDLANVSPSVATRDPLDSEITLLASARAALKQGDSATALTLLDRYAQLGARSLGAEATLLRVQALVQAGRSAEARAIAQAALNGKIASPYGARLQKLVAGGSSQSPR